MASLWTHSISASRASFASGMTDMLIMSPPHCRYICDSALVEKAGPGLVSIVSSVSCARHPPSMQTTVLSVCSLGEPSAALRISSTLGATNALSLLLNGLPNIEWTTSPSPRKNVSSLIPFVRSMIWSGMTKWPGAISSRSEPTAENATMAWTPMCFRAAMLARPGTSVGVMVCARPWREMKAMSAPEGRDEMVMGEEGLPQG